MTVLTDTRINFDMADRAIGGAHSLELLRPLASRRLDAGLATLALPPVRPADRAYRELEVVYEEAEKLLWYYMKPRARPCFSPDMLEDIRALQRSAEDMHAAAPASAPRYLVLGSRAEGIFNLGGDLRLFAQAIREGNRDTLDRYARACVDVLYPNATGLGLPVITIALVQGDALGGGFEAALSSHVIVAERSAKFGLPEVLFNLFPGMGAYSFLSRRIGPAQAERMILSGKIYGAAELHEMGVVDVLAEDGAGEAALRDYVKSVGRGHLARRAIYQTRNIVNPVTRAELHEVTQLWVDTALTLTDADLRRMEHLAAAQDRRRARQRCAA